MGILQMTLLGDSLSAGTIGGSLVALGGRGCYAELLAERLANISGVGPLLSSGARFCALGQMIGQQVEWTTSGGGWQNSGAGADVDDKSPYGYGLWSSGGSSNIATYTLPISSRSVVGFSVYYVDYNPAGNWQYSVDGGTWTNMTQPITHDNSLNKFYVATPVTSNIQFRAYDGSGNVGIMLSAVEMFYSKATSGFILHNLTVNGEKLHNLVPPGGTSGDRMAFFDSVKPGTGSVISNQPNAGTIMMHINDCSRNNASEWNTDLTTLNTRVSPIGPLGIMNPWECNTGTFDTSLQSIYRNQSKATGLIRGIPVLDFFDIWTANGWGDGFSGDQNTAIATGGVADLLTDNTHPKQSGDFEIANRVYWWALRRILKVTDGRSSIYTAKGTSASVAFKGSKSSSAVYSASVPIGIG